MHCTLGVADICPNLQPLRLCNAARPADIPVCRQVELSSSASAPWAMKRTVVMDVVGLSRSLIGNATPRIQQFARGGAVATIHPPFPAVTCTAQSNYLTGRLPSEHGVVGNGWYDRSLAEVQFWKQSNRL